jgi:hypothetical protein
MSAKKMVVKVKSNVKDVKVEDKDVKVEDKVVAKAKRGPRTEQQNKEHRERRLERNRAALKKCHGAALMKTRKACRFKKDELRLEATTITRDMAVARNAVQQAKNTVAYLQGNLQKLRDAFNSNTTYQQACSAQVLVLKEIRAENRKKKLAAAAASAAAGGAAGGAAAADEIEESSDDSSSDSDDEEDAVTTEGEAEEDF